MTPFNARLRIVVNYHILKTDTRSKVRLKNAGSLKQGLVRLLDSTSRSELQGFFMIRD